MKSFVTFLFILIASSTYRCGKEEETIDCVAATSSMIGSFDGTISYSSPQIANGQKHFFTLEITDVNECVFIGTSTYGTESNNTSFKVTGSIDKYGWVTFNETEYNNDGKLFTDCEKTGTQSWWCSDCNTWPIGRWRPGTIFNEGRYSNDPFEWVGEFVGSDNMQRPCQMLGGGIENWQYQGVPTGNYKLVKQ